MSTTRHVWLLAMLGCGDNLAAPRPDVGSDAAPALWNRVALADDELARQAARIVGANVAGARTGCNECHGVTRQRLRAWRAFTETARNECLLDLAVTTDASARYMIDCLRAMPDVEASDFAAGKLGMFSAATHLPWFQFAFTRGYGDNAAAQLAELQREAGMPRGETDPLTQDELDIVVEWFVRGLPLLDDTVPADPAPTSCTPSIGGKVATHVAAMTTAGWRAQNRIAMLAMHGCGNAADPRDCLAGVPRAADQAYGAGWDVAGRGELRVLRDMTYQTAYWTRSSPDGRFVAHGVANVDGSVVVDLQRDVAVPIAADLDPAFFPDNSGFAFHGPLRNTCAMSVLTSNPGAIEMTEPACTRVLSLGMYEHLGRMLGGNDYFATDSLFVSDDGGISPTLQGPDAAFGAQGFVDFTPMIFDGTKFVPRAFVRVPLPYEGDAVLAPSTRLLLTRLGGADERQLGYVLREIEITAAGSTYTIATPELARYCLGGSKPAFSFDERWIVFHRYVTAADAQELGFSSAADPGFAAYLTQGAANLYLMELTTGVPMRITAMRPGQYALFPHFRSDGWIYAQIRDRTTSHEYTIASDAALIAEQ